MFEKNKSVKRLVAPSLELPPLFPTPILALLAVMLLFGLSALAWGQITIPEAPSIPGVSAGEDEPIQYMLGGIKYVIQAAYLVVAVVGMIVYGSGLISDLNQARQRGEWGKFGVHLLVGMLVVLLVLFIGFWGNSYLDGLTGGT